MRMLMTERASVAVLRCDGCLSLFMDSTITHDADLRLVRTKNCG